MQHIIFAGLGSMCLGRMNALWEALSCASRVAQQISLHLDNTTWLYSLDELEKEMRRRTFCNLYVWDRFVPQFSLFLSDHRVCSNDIPTFMTAVYRNVLTVYPFYLMACPRILCPECISCPIITSEPMLQMFSQSAFFEPSLLNFGGATAQL